MADDRHRRRAGFRIVWYKGSPRDRLNLQHREEAGRDGPSGDDLRLIGARQAEAVAPIATGYGFKTSALFSPSDELGPSHGCGAFAAPTFPYVNNPVRLLDGQRPQENGMNNTEDGRVCADADRKREHRHSGEAGVLQQYPNRVTKILNYILHVHFACCSSVVLSRVDFSGSSIWPSRMWSTRFPYPALNSEWVTWIIVVPSRFNFWNSSIIWRPCSECRLPVGSSANSKRGRVIIARATATSCWRPPDSRLG